MAARTTLPCTNTLCTLRSTDRGLIGAGEVLQQYATSGGQFALVYLGTYIKSIKSNCQAEGDRKQDQPRRVSSAGQPGASSGQQEAQYWVLFGDS